MAVGNRYFYPQEAGSGKHIREGAWNQMRILLIRHGDPDYVHDTLTEKGHREAALLSEHAGALNIGDCYMSPLGRAQATAAYTLERLGKKAEVLGWLKEFPGQVDINPVGRVTEGIPQYKDGGREIPAAYCLGHGPFLSDGASRVFGDGELAAIFGGPA